MMMYDPYQWFWQIGDDTSRYYSTAARDWVEAPTHDYLVSRIESEAALWAELRRRAPDRLPASELLDDQIVSAPGDLVGGPTLADIYRGAG